MPAELTPEYWQETYIAGYITQTELFDRLIVRSEGESPSEYLDRIEPQYRRGFLTLAEKLPLEGFGVSINASYFPPPDSVILELRRVLRERVAEGWLPPEEDETGIDPDRG